MRAPLRIFLVSLLVLPLGESIHSHFFGRAYAQEGNFDIPPPPPISGDYDDVPIEEIPPDEIIDGPVYDAPPEETLVTPLPAGGNDPGQGPAGDPSRFGFSGSAPRPSFRPGSSGNGSAGGGSFGSTPSGTSLKFDIVEGEFWEKGKKRGRAPRGSN